MESIVKIWEKYSYVYLNGTIGTLWLSAVTVLAGTVLGTLLAFMKLSHIKPAQWFVGLFVEIIRGTPALLQIYFFWIFLPKLTPVKLSDAQCVIVALIVNASAYVAEIIRAGIEGVDPGQTEAALSLGLSPVHTMTKVILPQAVKNILPALGNEFIIMIKETSLASIFFIAELTTSYKTVQAATFLAIPSIVISGFIYLTLTFVLTRILGVLERRMRSSDR